MQEQEFKFRQFNKSQEDVDKLRRNKQESDKKIVELELKITRM